MEIKQVLKKLKINAQDIQILFVCFGLTMLISLVYYNYGTVKTTFNTVVEIIDDGKMVATKKDGKDLSDFTTKITVKSTEKIDESNFHAYVDLRSRIENDQYVPIANEGEYEFPIVVETSQSSTVEFNKFEYTPKTVKLKVEHKTEEFIKIKPTFSGELGVKGYEISEAECTLSPETIKISGGRTLVEKIKEQGLTTELIDKSKITNAFSKTTLEVKPNFSTLNSKLVKTNVDEDTVFICTIKLKQIQGQQNYDEVGVKFSNLNKDLEITNKKIFVSISLKGSEIKLKNIDASKILVTADCISIKEKGTYDIPITVIAPEGTSVLDQPQSVKVYVDEIPKVIHEEKVPEETEYTPPETEQNIEKNDSDQEIELEEVKDLELM